MLIGQTASGDPLLLAKDIGIPGATDRLATPATVQHPPSDPEVKEWTTLLKQLFSNDETPSVYNLMGIGSAQVMAAALKAARADLTREKYLAPMAHVRAKLIRFRPQLFAMIR